MFQVGDVVRRKARNAPIKVTYYNQDTHSLEGLYLRSGVHSSGPAWSYIYFDENETTNEEENTMEDMNTTTLYEVTTKGKDSVFATYLATDSDSKYVMEEKGTGRIFKANTDTVREVLPYTISIKYLGSHEPYHFLAKEGEYQKGDIYLIDTQSIVVVHEVNTESRKATKDFLPIAKFTVDKLTTV